MSSPYETFNVLSFTCIMNEYIRNATLSTCNHLFDLLPPRAHASVSKTHQENIRALMVSPVLAAQWLINDGEYLPSYSWVCPTGASGMVAEAADAYWCCLHTPARVSRKQAYCIFFSGGYGGRTTSSYQLWDHMDMEFDDLTVAEAKVCSHNRLSRQNAMDDARMATARGLAEYAVRPEGVLGYAVDADSDDGSDLPAPPANANSANGAEELTPSAVRLRQRLNSLVRTATDTSPAHEDRPLLVPERCVDDSCTKQGHLNMRKCAICAGALHNLCGRALDPDDDDGCERCCSSCANSNKGKRKATS